MSLSGLLSERLSEVSSTLSNFLLPLTSVETLLTAVLDEFALLTGETLLLGAGLLDVVDALTAETSSLEGVIDIDTDESLSGFFKLSTVTIDSCTQGLGFTLLTVTLEGLEVTVQTDELSDECDTVEVVVT